MTKSKQPGNSRAERAKTLREGAERFRAFVMASSDVVYRMSPDWKEMRYLKGKDFLADTEDPSSLWIEKYILAEDRPHILAAIEEAIRDRSIFELEHRVIRADQTIGWTHSRAVPVLDEQGGILEWLGTAKDVTERIRAEEELRQAHQAAAQSEQRLQRVLETEAVGVLFFDYSGMVIQANDVFLRMTGYRREQIERRELTWHNMTPPEWVAESEAQMEQFAQTSRIGPYEKEYFLADGSRRWMLFAGRDLGEGTIAEYCIDITDRKHVEEDLRRSEERLRLIIEGAKGFAIFTTDADGIINSWNGGAEQVFGWSEAEILGQNASVMFTPEDRATGEPQKELNTARENGIAPDVRWHLRKDGARVFINGEVRPLRDGQLSGFFKIGRDVTAQRQAEDALREHQKQLQSLNETLEQKVREKTGEVRRLASDVISATQRERQRISRVLHDDLQQRVYAIQMQLAFLRDALPAENAAAQKDVPEIEKELSGIVKTMRNLSIDLSPPILSGEGLAHAVAWLVDRMHEQFGLLVELQANGSFVIPNQDLHVLLFNCIRELLFNVVKHAEASRAVVTLAWVEHSLQIEVRDDGKGFLREPSEQGRDKYHRSLGLPTIGHQLSMFGGRMEIHSEPGAGTQITLIVPQVDAQL